MSIFTREMAAEIVDRTNGILRIPEGVTELAGDFAFLFDSRPGERSHPFREICIPKTVVRIEGIFLTEYGPDSVPVKRFKKITADPENPCFTSADGVLFTKDMSTLVCYPCGKSGDSYKVPGSVRTVGEGAFENNVNLRKIELSPGVKRLERQAFFQCEMLTDIILPEGLEYIGEECFDLSTKINRIRIPESIRTLYTSAISSGIVMEIPDSFDSLEYDYVPTEWLDMPFMGPAVLTNDNETIADFAESYDYNHFEGYVEDGDGIIWSADRKTLICFPSRWESDTYELPEDAEYVYKKAFSSTTVKRFFSNRKIVIKGYDAGESKYCEPVSGRKFHISAGMIFADKEQADETVSKERTEPAKPLMMQKKEGSGYAFISYSSKNQMKANATRQVLIDNGISCWMAPYDIPAGSKYAQVINDALENCSCLVLLLTKESQESQFVEREVGRAVSYKKPIVTMQLEELKLNSGFKFYIGEEQIVPVQDIDRDSPEMRKIIRGIKSFTDEA